MDSLDTYTTSMNILLHVTWKVVLDHNPYMVYMYTSSTNVRRKQEGYFSARKGMDISFPDMLRHVTVKFQARYAIFQKELSTVLQCLYFGEKNDTEGSLPAIFGLFGFLQSNQQLARLLVFCANVQRLGDIGGNL